MNRPAHNKPSPDLWATRCSAALWQNRFHQRIWTNLAALLILCLIAVTRSHAAKPTEFPDFPASTQAATNLSKTLLTNSVSPDNSVSMSGTNSMESLDDKYKLAIGDRLSFRIVEDEEDPKPLFVTDSGELEVPYLGRFPAEGKTCKQLAIELKNELQKDYYYQATVVVAVDLMTKSRGKVYLVGPVRMPGPQDIPSDEIFTLSKAILRAGGFGDFADKRGVRVTRKGSAGTKEKTFTVDVGQILEKGKAEADLILQPGDFIYVPERSIRF
jgi:polysaccharide export outer membrane protein